MPVQEITASVTAAGVEIRPQRIVAERSQHVEAGKVTVTGVPAGPIPDTGTIRLSVNDELVFTGTIDEVDDTKHGSVVVDAYDAYRPLQLTTVQQEFVQAPIRQVVRETCQRAGVDVNINLDQQPIRPTTLELAGAAVSSNFDIQRLNSVLTMSVNSQPASKILTRAGYLADAGWYVDATNTVQFTRRPNRTDHTVQYLLDASAGKRSPAYESVLVIGASPTSSQGQQRSHMYTRVPPAAIAGSGSPQYQYRDQAIRTEQQAANVANAILKRFERQQRSGHVTVVGKPTITPWDTITMPEDEGGETYFVSGVKHTLDGSNGYETRVECGGVFEDFDS